MAMQSLETTYGQDLNGDGTVGLKVTTIEAIGTTDFKQVADTYFLYDHGTTTGPQLKMSGAAVTVGQFDTWTPIGAEHSGGGYLVVWKNGAADQYIVWNVDGGGNLLSTGSRLSGASYALQSLESAFGQNLNGDGTLGPVTAVAIETFGATTLAQVADSHFLYAAGTTSGPQLRYDGAYVTLGQFGAWTPIGVEHSGGGYLVVWKNGAADQYIVWNVDGGGNLLSTGSRLSGASYALQSLEVAFGQNLNGDGTLGPVTAVAIETFGATTLAQVADSYSLYATAPPRGRS